MMALMVVSLEGRIDGRVFYFEMGNEEICI
jgi:hypothetical protein